MLVNLVHGFPDSENLYYSELVTITAAMIMQLRDPSFSHDTTMPVRGSFPLSFSALLSVTI